MHAPVNVLRQVLGTLRQFLGRRAPPPSDEAGNAGGGFMTLARGQLSGDAKDAAVTTVVILGGGCICTDWGAVSTHTHLIQ